MAEATPRRGASGLNKVMLIGNLGNDPEMRFTASGTALTTFPVAVNRNSRTPEGEWREETEWFNIVAWSELAERLAQNLHKGRKVYVEGRLQTRSWEGQDGQKRYRTEVVASTMQLLDSRPQPEATADETGV